MGTEETWFSRSLRDVRSLGQAEKIEAGSTHAQDEEAELGNELETENVCIKNSLGTMCHAAMSCRQRTCALEQSGHDVPCDELETENMCKLHYVPCGDAQPLRRNIARLPFDWNSTGYSGKPRLAHIKAVYNIY